MMKNLSSTARENCDLPAVDAGYRLSAATQHQLLLRNERDSFLKELKAQNDLILLDHKKQLDAQLQIKSLIEGLQGEKSRVKLDPVLPQNLYEDARSFIETTRRTQTAPQAIPYVKKRTGNVRALSCNSTLNHYQNFSLGLVCDDAMDLNDEPDYFGKSINGHIESPYKMKKYKSKNRTSLQRNKHIGRSTDPVSDSRGTLPKGSHTDISSHGTLSAMLVDDDRRNEVESEVESSDKNQLHSSLRSFISKTETILMDVRKVKKSIRGKKQTKGGEKGEPLNNQLKNYSDQLQNNAANTTGSSSSNGIDISSSSSGSSSISNLPYIEEKNRKIGIISNNQNPNFDPSKIPKKIENKNANRNSAAEEKKQKLSGIGWINQKKDNRSIFKECSAPLKKKNFPDEITVRQNTFLTESNAKDSSSLEHSSLENIPGGHTTNEWQNELARHILSVYASTAAKDDVSSRDAILGFVDIKGEIDMQSVAKDLFKGARRKSMVGLEEENKEVDDNGDFKNAIVACRNDTASNSTKLSHRRSSNNINNININNSNINNNNDNNSSNGMNNPGKIEPIKARRRRLSPASFRTRNHNIVTAIRSHTLASTPSSSSASVRPMLTSSSSSCRSSLLHMSPSSSRVGDKIGTKGVDITDTVRAEDGCTYLRLRGPPVCFPVWFAGTGDVYSDWSLLLGGGLEGAKLDAQLKVMFEHREFKEYVAVVEDSLNRTLKEVQMDEGVHSIGEGNGGNKGTLCTLWLQLISTGVAMASLSVDARQFDIALNILQMSKEWSSRVDILTHRQSQSCKAHVFDTYAYFFFRRKKLSAALHHAELSKSIHEKVSNYDGLAACLLHIAAILTQQAKYTEAHKYLYHILALLDDGRLQFSTASPSQLCLVAVCFHNLAVVQIKMQASDMACKSSQNAQKVARLCLSVSTRYVSAFQRTHEAALSDLQYHMQYRSVAAGYGEHVANFDTRQLKTVNEMIEKLFQASEDFS